MYLFLGLVYDYSLVLVVWYVLYWVVLIILFGGFVYDFKINWGKEYVILMCIGFVFEFIVDFIGKII